MTKEASLNKFGLLSDGEVHAYADELSPAMDAYAQSQAIAFAEWTCSGLWSTYDGKWYEYRNEDNTITGEQLYQLFLQQHNQG